MLKLTSLILIALALAPRASAQVVRVSVSSAGGQASSFSVNPDISRDGRFVVFASGASDLVDGDTNGFSDIFLHDRDADADGVFDEPGEVATLVISRPPGGQANGASELPRISGDGRFVVFRSYAGNLAGPGVPRPPDAITQLYRTDRVTGETRLVSEGPLGLANGSTVDCSVSADGQVVAFQTGATNLVDGDPGFGGAIIVRDLAAGSLIRVSAPQPGSSSGTVFSVILPRISADGRLVHFVEQQRRQPTLCCAEVFGRSILFDRATGRSQDGVAFGWPMLMTDDGRRLVGLGREGVRTTIGVPEPTALFRVELARFEPFPVPESTRGITDVSPDGRYALVLRDGPNGLPNDLALFDLQLRLAFPLNLSTVEGRFAGSRFVAFTTNAALVAGDTNDRRDVYVVDLDRFFDVDTDGLDDRWETFFGLSTTTGLADDGPNGDPDGDGVSNAAEQAAGTHPRGRHVRYLAEGVSNAFFRTRFAIANPEVAPAMVTAVVRHERADGTYAAQPLGVSAMERRTVYADEVPGLGNADFATRVESDHPLVVDRLVSWDSRGYGSHAETASSALSTTWFLAEGTTVEQFQLFYLLQNPQTTATTATIHFLRPSGAPLERTYELPPASRTTIYVNTIAPLEATDVAAAITATQPIAVERAMYRHSALHPFWLGHAAAAVAQPATSWFLAEGATGEFFDTYVLLANPGTQAASVQLDFLRDAGGVVTRTYTVAPGARFTVFVDAIPEVASHTFGTRITSTVPIVVERAMYWPGGFYDYFEGHVSAGATQTGSAFMLAEGEGGGDRGADTFALVANTSPAPITVSVTRLSEPGESIGTLLGAFTVPAHGRLTLPLTFLTNSRRFGVLVSDASMSNALVVEGVLYWSVGQIWDAGANWPATRVR